jgi:hypothetical protein
MKRGVPDPWIPLLLQKTRRKCRHFLQFMNDVFGWFRFGIGKFLLLDEGPVRSGGSRRWLWEKWTCLDKQATLVQTFSDFWLISRGSSRSFVN